MQQAIRYIHDGGFFMYPIILGSLWALTLLFERAIFYFQTGGNLTRQVKTVFELLANNDTAGALEFLKNQKGVLRNVLTTALSSPATIPVEQVAKKMEAVIAEQLPGYSRYLNLLASLAALMPIFGLLGTVSGMITTFNVISLHGTGDAQAMAGGIAEALITTQAGLVAAAPMMLGHVLLTSRLKKISDKTREACIKFIAWRKESHV